MKTAWFSLVVIAWAWFAAVVTAADQQPSLLFCSPQGAAGGWVDLTYLAELRAQGWQVDYTEALAEVTAARIQRYSALVIYITPDAYDVTMRGQKSSPEKTRSFAALIEGYVASGGGVLLLPTEGNVLKQAVVDLTSLWGAKLPIERIEEQDQNKIGYLSQPRCEQLAE